jgi:hypothetical protein
LDLIADIARSFITDQSKAIRVSFQIITFVRYNWMTLTSIRRRLRRKSDVPPGGLQRHIAVDDLPQIHRTYAPMG